MMEEEGVVVKLEDGKAIIHSERGSSCSKCSSKSACEALGGSGGKTMETRAINEVGATVGDTVKFAIDSVVFLKSSFLIYIVPLVVMIIGGILGEGYAEKNLQEWDSDLVAAIAGLFSLVIAFLLIKLWSKSVEKKAKYQPQVTAILKHNK